MARLGEPVPALPAPDTPSSAGPEPPVLDADGVDTTLVRWMLSLTPAERLEALQGFVDSVSELRGDGRA
jgi:hypothetical protein